MIHFDFMLDAEDAELLFDCVQQEINKLKAACLNFSSEELGRDTNGGISSQPTIFSGKNRGTRKPEVGGNWLYIR
jgi:hypothetical protein